VGVGAAAAPGLAAALTATGDPWIAHYRDVLEKALETVRQRLTTTGAHDGAPPAGTELEASADRPPAVAPIPPTPRTPDERAAVVMPAPSKTLAYVALGAAGFLTATGIGAWAVHEHEAGVYDDDSRCLQGTTTRDQQCGGRATEARVALGVELGAFVGAAAALTYAVVRLATAGAASKSATREPACGPWLALGVRCGGRF
jgi:hypothetical protein